MLVLNFLNFDRKIFLFLFWVLGIMKMISRISARKIEREGMKL